MALFDDDNQFAGFEEEEQTAPISELESEEAPKPPPANRNFIIGISILGGIILLGIIGVILFAIFGGGNTAQQQEAARIDAANTATMRAATDIAGTEEAVRATEREINRMTLNAPTITQSPTPVVSFGTETPQATQTRVERTLNATQMELTRQADEKGGNTTPTFTPTATLSEAAAQTATALAGMPGTGFADEVGLPLMVGMAALLLVIIFVARRLRTA